MLDIVFMSRKWYILGGLLLGGAWGIFKFGSYAFIFRKLFTSKSGNGQEKHAGINSVAIFVINQLLLLPLLFISLKFDLWFFYGVAAGILLVPFVILFNIITETLKITHNNFE